MKVSNLGAMPENSNRKEGIESRHDAGDSEIKKRKGLNLVAITENPKKTKGSNPSAIPKNPKQNEGNESGRDARKPEKKETDRIRARCKRTRNKTNGTNPSTILENPKQNE